MHLLVSKGSLLEFMIETRRRRSSDRVASHPRGDPLAAPNDEEPQSKLQEACVETREYLKILLWLGVKQLNSMAVNKYPQCLGYLVFFSCTRSNLPLRKGFLTGLAIHVFSPIALCC